VSELQLTGIIKHYEGVARPVIPDLSLTVPAGQMAVLVGPSGCGKSTTLRMVAGLEDATAGTIKIGGRDVTNLPPADRDIAMVFQSYALYPHMTVFENMAFGLRIKKMAEAEIQSRVYAAADSLGLRPYLERRPKALSGGQRQRVAIARAVLRNPTLMLLDEATSALDNATEKKVIAGLETLRCTRITVAHRLSTVRNCDLIVVMEKGRIVEQGNHDQLVANGGLYSQLLAASQATTPNAPEIPYEAAHALRSAASSMRVARNAPERG
jgi:multiple sugar transport system ATP-binding protein